jgi:hypothetical protein
MPASVAPLPVPVSARCARFLAVAFDPLPSRASSDVVAGKAEEEDGPGLAVDDENAARRRGWRRAAGNGIEGHGHGCG